MTDRDQLRRLLSAGCDEGLTPSSQEKLTTLVQRNPDLIGDYVEYVATESLIEQACGLSFRDEGGATTSLPTSAPLTVPATAASSVEASTPRRTARPDANWLSRFASRSAWAVAALVLLAVTIGLSRLANPPLSTIVAVSDAQLVDGRELHPGGAINDQWVDLDRGSVRIALRDGAMASIKSPARFRVLSGNAAELDYGAVTCEVPESAHGFSLGGRNAKIVDLGTGFRTVALPDGSLSVHVTRGAVRLEPNSEAPLQLDAGRLATVRRDGTLGSTGKLSKRPAVSGQFRFLGEHPESLGYDEFVHDDKAFVFLESHAVKLPHDLRLDLAEVGTHTSFLGSPTVIPQGTVVDCYLIHCAPQRKRHEVAGGVVFPGKILGVLGNDDRLNATNELLGAQWTLACQHPERGVESLPDVNSDRLWISRDRRTLTGHFRTMSIDQIRVLVTHGE